MVGERALDLTGGNQSLAAQQRLRYPSCPVPNWTFLSK